MSKKKDRPTPSIVPPKRDADDSSALDALQTGKTALKSKKAKTPKSNSVASTSSSNESKRTGEAERQTTENRRRVLAYMPFDLATRLKMHSFQTDQTMTDVVNAAVEEYLDRHSG